MKVACTAKARELVKSSQFVQFADDNTTDFFSWHAHVYVYQRYKILLLINDLTGFPVVFYRPKVAQLKNFKSLAQEAIREAFLDYGLKPEHIELYFKMAGEIQLTSKTSRSTLARLKEWKNIATFALARRHISPLHEDRLTQPAFSRKVFPWSWTDYEPTTELLTKAFERYLNVKVEDLYDVESFELQVKLMLEKHQITRRILVPANTTLDILHKVIRTAFGWGNHHLHQFILLPPGATSIYVPTDILIQNAEVGEELELWDNVKPVLSDASTTIKDVLELPYELWYEHDLGDSWVHRITLVQTHRLPNREYRILEAIGTTPPDDVGGESGFNEFLEVMADENHIDHGALGKWYDMQTSHRMNIAQINLISIPD